MLQQQDNGIYEGNAQALTASAQTISVGSVTFGEVTTGYCHPTTYYDLQPIYWQQYPVYVCTDKTKKAIEVLKALQADKLLTCNSVARFIELVEKISNIL
jgi:hypothetical protein